MSLSRSAEGFWLITSRSKGHYVGWCASDAKGDVDPDKQEWFKFDDEKVSMVSREKITLLEGGGEFWADLSTWWSAC